MEAVDSRSFGCFALSGEASISGSVSDRSRFVKSSRSGSLLVDVRPLLLSLGGLRGDDGPRRSRIECIARFLNCNSSDPPSSPFWELFGRSLLRSLCFAGGLLLSGERPLRSAALGFTCRSSLARFFPEPEAPFTGDLERRTAAFTCNRFFLRSRRLRSRERDRLESEEEEDEEDEEDEDEDVDGDLLFFLFFRFLDVLVFVGPIF
mmetsp:Transcript_13823/g.29505  ORF Transcript_13823/g.29505 Transcript_13823/m.29505 type:complete len:206 (+) Transcript_13823:657-1274(+)